jgi:hypothetical protein
MVLQHACNIKLIWTHIFHFKAKEWNFQLEINKLQLKNMNVVFQVLTSVSMKMAVFWVVVPCNLAEVYWRCRYLSASIISETSVVFYQTTRCNNSEDGHLRNDGSSRDIISFCSLQCISESGNFRRFVILLSSATSRSRWSLTDLSLPRYYRWLQTVNT